MVVLDSVPPEMVPVRVLVPAMVMLDKVVAVMDPPVMVPKLVVVPTRVVSVRVEFEKLAPLMVTLVNVPLLMVELVRLMRVLF